MERFIQLSTPRTTSPTRSLVSSFSLLSRQNCLLIDLIDINETV